MKDRKFLEQLNLYLDGEIDPADAAEFEQEILSNPARRRIYHDLAGEGLTVNCAGRTTNHAHGIGAVHARVGDH